MKWLSKLINSDIAKDLAKARGQYISNVLDGLKEEEKKKLLKMLLEEFKDNEDI